MISVIMLCKNNQEYIRETLEALSKFNEVVLVDTGSDDRTLEIASRFANVKIYKKKMEGFGTVRNAGAKLAKNDWILAIDADEVVSNRLADEIFSLNLDKTKVYKIPFKSFYNGKWIRGCGWHPESHVRLYNKKTTKFSNLKVHEAVLTERLEIIKLKNYINHTSYRNTHDFLKKMQNYSELFALQNVGKKKSSFLKALIHGSFAFFKSYLLKRGFLMGKEGFIISAYNANTAFYKYLKLSEYNDAHNDFISSSRKGKICKLSKDAK